MTRDVIRRLKSLEQRLPPASEEAATDLTADDLAQIREGIRVAWEHKRVLASLPATSQLSAERETATQELSRDLESFVLNCRKGAEQ